MHTHKCANTSTDMINIQSYTQARKHKHTGHVESALFEKANNVGVQARHPELRQIRLYM